MAAVLLAILWLVSWYAVRRRSFVCRQLAGEQRADEACREVSTTKRRLKSFLFVCGVVLSLLALARPWWGKRLIPYPSRSRDVLVVFDCSRSMLADDVAPSRLDHGKWLVQKLLSRFPGDRFGLVAFAGSAFLECPLTQDHGSFRLILDELDTRTIPLGGTNLSRALQVANDAFEGAEGVDQAVVLVTDGDELQGDSMAVAETLRKKKIPLFILGLGNPARGALIRDETGSFVRDEDNKLVTTKLAESRLKQLAGQTHGVYVRSTTISPNLNPVMQKIEALVPAEKEEQVKRREIERYQIPLALSVGCFLVFLCVGEKKRRMLAILLGFWVAATVQTRGETGTSAPENDTRAMSDLQTAAEQAAGEEKARLYQNLGVQYQTDGDFKKAEEAYNQAVLYGREDGDVATAAQWNLGVIRHQMARDMMLQKPSEALKSLDAAETNYRQALRWTERPSALGKNQELLLKDRETAEEIKKQQEQQSQQQQKNGEDPDKNQQQQQNDQDQNKSADQADQTNGESAENQQQEKAEPGDDPIQNSQSADGDQQQTDQGENAETPEGMLDKKQAAAVLADMRAKEKNLRQALKEQQMRNAKNRPVDKNW